MDYPSYDPKSPNTPLTEEELAGLDDLLTTLPADGSMTLDGMDGYLTALLVGPPLFDKLASSDWIPVIWGGDTDPAPAPFSSNQKRKRTTVLVLRHLRSIEAALSSPNPDAWEPVFSVAEAPGGADRPEGEELADATDWCMGFLAATDLAPEAWKPLFADADVGPGLATIAWLGGDVDVAADAEDRPDEDELEDPQVRDQLSRAAAEVVLKLWARKGAPA